MCSNNKQYLSDLNDALIGSAKALSKTLRSIDSPHACSVRKVGVALAYESVINAHATFHQAVIKELKKTLSPEEIEQLKQEMEERIEAEVEKTLLNSLASDISRN